MKEKREGTGRGEQGAQLEERKAGVQGGSRQGGSSNQESAYLLSKEGRRDQEGKRNICMN
jgi:hypothetical protein